MKALRTILFFLAAICIVQVMRGAEPTIGGKKANQQIKQATNTVRRAVPPRAVTMAPKKAPATIESYLTRISVSPYGTIVHDGIGDGESYGAGIALGLGINDFVSIELTATTYSDNDWRDEAVDESAALVKARLVRNAAETMSLYALGGIDRDWGLDDWALSVGGGVQLTVHKNVSFFADSRLRAWMTDSDEKTKDIATRLGISLSF